MTKASANDTTREDSGYVTEGTTKETSDVATRDVSQCEEGTTQATGNATTQEGDVVRKYENYTFEEAIDRVNVQQDGRPSIPTHSFPGEGLMRVVRATWGRNNAERRVKTTDRGNKL